MLKNLAKMGISAVLVISLFFLPFGGVKKANAAGPAIFTLSVIAASVASYFGFRGPHFYRYRSKPYPAEVRSGPHYLESIDGYYFIDSQGRTWLGDERTESWVLQPQKNKTK